MAPISEVVGTTVIYISQLKLVINKYIKSIIFVGRRIFNVVQLTPFLFIEKYCNEMYC